MELVMTRKAKPQPPADSFCKSLMRKIFTPSITAAAICPTSPASPKRTPVSNWREVLAMVASTPSPWASRVLVWVKSILAAEALAAARSSGERLATSTSRSGRGCGARRSSTVAGRLAGCATATAWAGTGGGERSSNTDRSSGAEEIVSGIGNSGYGESLA